MHRRLITLTVSALLGALALTGCGGDDPDTEAGGVAETTEAGVAETTEAGGVAETTEAGSGELVGDDDATLTVYSGRSEELVGPLLERFEEDTGITVAVRYGDTAEMAGQIIEEGDRSPADVYYGQDAGALGALADEGVLAPLDPDVIDAVDEQFRSVDDLWVGTSGRARAVAYNTEAVDEDELPDSILDFTDPRWEGRLGWAPTNGSFQAFVTALRVIEGEDGARAWLEGIEANDPVAYNGNSAIVEAVAAGEIDAGFVNHYYRYQLAADGSDMSDVENHYDSDGNPGALVNVAGVGVVASTGEREAAERFVAYLLEEDAQEYFATETFELPLVEDVEADPALPDLGSLTQPDIDLNQLDDLAGTLELLTEVGIL